MRTVFIVVVLLILIPSIGLAQKKELYFFFDRSKGDATLTENYIEKKCVNNQIIFEKGIGKLGHLGVDQFIHNRKEHKAQQICKKDLKNYSLQKIKNIEKIVILPIQDKLKFTVSCFDVYVIELNEKNSYILYEVSWTRLFHSE